MQYLFLCCFDEKRWDAIPEGERDRVMRDYGEFVQDLVKSGHYRGGAKLQGTSSATTVRAKNGKAAITDGPFAETKEQLGGFFLIEARDLNEALSIAAKIPPARIGSIEVRAIRDLSEYVDLARRRSTNQAS